MTSTSEENDSKNPQEQLNDFWENLITKKPGKVTNIFPPSLYANLLAPPCKSGVAKGKNAAESYQAAADECRARVKRIIRECRRTNEKFTDPEFDIQGDFSVKNCLEGLMNWYNSSQESGSSVGPGRLQEALLTLSESGLLSDSNLEVNINAINQALDYAPSSGEGPGSVHRIDWIFENPSFTVDGYSSSDVKQGANGDCWFIAAVAALCSSSTLMDKVCVEKDAECGVYGFVFYRDGEWIWTVVDDNLYVTYKDFDAYGDMYDPTGAREKKWKKNNQTGSDGLYFAKCADQNETWLPLLEKAYAKVHGDYDAIAGGWSGEGVEDLTGGVTTKILTNRILSKNHLWEELLKANTDLLFSASSPGSYGDDTSARQGLALNHAYSIIKAVEEEGEDGKKHRLVLIRNPWGMRMNASMGEWNGPWADGSSEWTPYWMNKLNHKFGNDGLFWMSYDDLRARFNILDRTRLFDKDWTVVQHWTSVSVAWVTGYLNTKFEVQIKKAGPTVFVLCQLDERYFKGLEGKYTFDLHFVLQEKNAKPGEHIVRARGAWFGNRSISAEVDLEPGTYEIVPKIVAFRNANAPDVHDIVTKLANANPQKLRQIGMNYDIANSKACVELTAEQTKRTEEKKKAADKKKRKEEEEAVKEKAEFEVWKKEKKEREAKVQVEKEKIEKEQTGKKESDSVRVSVEKSIDEKKEDTPAQVKTQTVEAEKTADGEKEEAEVASSSETVKDELAPVEKESEKETGKGTKQGGEKNAENEIKKEAGKEVQKEVEKEAEKDAEKETVKDTEEGADKRTVEEADKETEDKSSSDAAKSASENKQNPWNAVCVLGLRVYSQDPEVSIKLVMPKDPEEGAVLDADGATQAGATM